MTREPSPAASTGADDGASDRLDSWKDVAAYLRRDVTTVQRWERREGLPIRRHVHDKQGSVYAFRSELDTWQRTRTRQVEAGETVPSPASEQLARTPRTAVCRRFRRFNDQRPRRAWRSVGSQPSPV